MRALQVMPAQGACMHMSSSLGWHMHVMTAASSQAGVHSGASHWSYIEVVYLLRQREHAWLEAGNHLCRAMRSSITLLACTGTQLDGPNHLRDMSSPCASRPPGSCLFLAGIFICP